MRKSSMRVISGATFCVLILLLLGCGGGGNGNTVCGITVGFPQSRMSMITKVSVEASAAAVDVNFNNIGESVT